MPKQEGHASGGHRTGGGSFQANTLAGPGSWQGQLVHRWNMQMVYCRKKKVLFDEDSEKERRQLSSEHHSLDRLCRVCSVEREAPDCSTCCRSDQLGSENGWGDQSWACWVDMWIYSLSGRAAEQAKKWGGDGMSWLLSQGLRGARGSTTEKVVEGGCAIGSNERWKPRVGHYTVDSRGWGRYCAQLIQGGATWSRCMVVFELMLPTAGSGMYKEQAAEMEAMRSQGEIGIEDNPVSQALRDIHDEMMKISMKAGREVAFVLMGDLNQTWGGIRGAGPFGNIAQAFKRFGLVNAMQHRHNKQFWTYEGNSSKGVVRTAIDHILVSDCIADGIRSIGVLQGENLNKSDHKMLCMVLEPSHWLKIDAKGARMPRKPRSMTYSVDPRPARPSYWSASTSRHTVLALPPDPSHPRCPISSSFLPGIYTPATLATPRPSAAVSLSMDSTMRQCVTMLHEAHDAVAGKPKLKPKLRSRWKQPNSPELKWRTHKMKKLHRMLRAVKRRSYRKARAMSASFRVQHKLDLCAPLEQDQGRKGWRRNWGRWEERVKNLIEKLKSECDIASRVAWRCARKKNHAKIEENIKEGEVARVFDRILQNERDELDRTCLVTGEDEGDGIQKGQFVLWPKRKDEMQQQGALVLQFGKVVRVVGDGTGWDDHLVVAEWATIDEPSEFIVPSEQAWTDYPHMQCWTKKEGEGTTKIHQDAVWQTRVSHPMDSRGEHGDSSSLWIDEEEADFDLMIRIMGNGEGFSDLTKTRRVVTDPEEIGEELRNFFAKWFGEGESTWFQQWEGEGAEKKIVWTHPLFERTVAGKKQRERLIEVMSKVEDDGTECWDKADRDWVKEMEKDIPEQYRWVLRLYGRKYCPQLGRRVTESDYEERAVMQPITAEVWDTHWAYAPSNKAKDKQGTDSNMFNPGRLLNYE